MQYIYKVWEGHRNMSIMDKLSQKESWELFYEYKTSLVCADLFRKQLREFIDREAYLPVTDRMAQGEAWPLPKRSVITKMSTQKKADGLHLSACGKHGAETADLSAAAQV